jgi:hypothetical protein
LLLPLLQAAAAGYAAAHDDLLGEDAIQWLIEAGSNGMVTRAKGWAGASHWKYRAVPQVGALTVPHDCRGTPML